LSKGHDDDADSHQNHQYVFDFIIKSENLQLSIKERMSVSKFSNLSVLISYFPIKGTSTVILLVKMEFETKKNHNLHSTMREVAERMKQSSRAHQEVNEALFRSQRQVVLLLEDIACLRAYKDKIQDEVCKN
jgi:hypothetical protein